MEALGKDKGIIYNIQRFSIHDGSGIRTIFFMKGCPLRCVWCCNPESQSIEPEIMFLKDQCIGCMNCVKNCRHDMFEIDRHKCIVCGSCTRVCPANAKRIAGRYVTLEDIKNAADRDRLIYRNSGGGVTFSGGEPLLQYEFVGAAAKMLKIQDIPVAIETSGFAPWEHMAHAVEYMDEIFMDIKHMNSDKHKELTGVRNELILENAEKVAKLGKRTTFRVPMIPEQADPGAEHQEEDFTNIGKFIGSLTDRDDLFIEILPYHKLGESKFDWLGRPYELDGLGVPAEEVTSRYEGILKSFGCNVIRKGEMV